jgi:Flp pilus assembly protein CpaB
VENIMSSKLFRTRQGTILLGVVAAVLAAIALIVYLNQYRNSVNKGAVPQQVLVAKKLIQQDTSGELIASSGLYTVKQVAKSAVQTGAFVDTSDLAGKVALKNIYPGDQLTAADFATGVVSVNQALSRGQRAVVIPLDSPGEVDGQVAPGDDVDVYALINATTTNGSTVPVVREVLQNMYVLNTDSTGVTLRATPLEAAKLIFASGNEKLWLTLRPPRGSVTKKPPIITTNTLLGK